MFCQLFSLQNKSFLCLQHIENKGFQTVIKHRLKAIQKHIKNELGSREKNTKNAHFVLKKCTFRFRDYSSLIKSSRLLILYNSVNSIFSLIPQRIFCINSKCQRNKVSKALCHVRNFTYLGAAKLERNKISNVTKVAIKKREHNFFRRNLSHNGCFFQFGD